MNGFQRLCSGRLIPIPALTISLIGLGGFAANSPALFEDIPASKSGITWIHENARSDKRYLPETLGPGCAFLDFDNDGWMDIYLVNYGPSDFYTPPKPLQSALYRNNQNGSFTDVTAKAGELRHIPMNQVVIEVLQSLPRMHHNPFVFFGRESQSLHNGVKHSDWKKDLKTAGIKNLRWHDL